MNKQYKSDRKNKSIFSILVIIVIFIAVIVGGVFMYYNSLLAPKDAKGEEKMVSIPQGYSVKGISKILEEEGIIKNNLAFLVAIKLENLQGKLQSGNYLLSPAMSTKEVIYRIVGGQVIDDSIKVTIPEGYQLTAIGERLEEKGLTTKEKFLKAAQRVENYDYSFLKDIPKDRETPLEGYLFPDTYRFPQGTSEEEIINRMLSRFNKVFTKEYIKQAKKLNMSIDDIVVLASIIEQETKHEVDRAPVAGVFYNRLKVNMPLQSDVTVLYALGEKKEKVLYKDLKVDSKYNTYIYTGLPIGPIGSFGDSSLKAALYPEENDYLYFLAKSDGYCVYNKTFSEHKKDAKKYLK